MSGLSPVVADAFWLLRQDLYRHIDEAEFLAMKITEWSTADTQAARRLIPDLVAVIRGVVALHDARAGGSCRSCGQAWPCESFETLHKLVKDPGNEFVTLVRLDAGCPAT